MFKFNMYPSLKFMFLFLSVGLVFFYNSCVTCNCDDVSKNPIITKNTYRDFDIKTNIFEFTQNKQFIEHYKTDHIIDTLKSDEFLFEYYLDSKMTSYHTVPIQHSPKNASGGYGLYACSCVDPIIVDSSLHHYDTLNHIDIYSLYDIGANIRKGDLLNDSIYKFNPYVDASQQTQDSTINVLNSTMELPRRAFLKLKTKVSEKIPVQFKIVATTKSGQTYTDSTLLIYLKPN